MKDAEVKTWLSAKKYPDAEHALKAHWGLERMMGADKAGRTVMLPKDENDADGWKSLSQRLGVPEKPEDYKLPIPQGADDGFAKTASAWFHEAGVPPRMANFVANKWNEYIAGEVQKGEAADKAESEKQMTALRQEWGHEFDAKAELGRRGFAEFAKQFGLDDKAALDRAESVLGSANLVKFFAGIGSLNAESQFAGGGAPGNFRMSVNDAQREIDQITAERTAGKINDYQWRKEAEPRLRKLAEVIAGGAR